MDTDGERGLLFCAAKRSGAFPPNMPVGSIAARSTRQRQIDNSSLFLELTTTKTKPDPDIQARPSRTHTRPTSILIHWLSQKHLP